MSTIARIELYHVAIPLPATFYPSWIPGFPQTENRFTLIKVITDDGVEGYSAGPALGGVAGGPVTEWLEGNEEGCGESSVQEAKGFLLTARE